MTDRKRFRRIARLCHSITALLFIQGSQAFSPNPQARSRVVGTAIHPMMGTVTTGRSRVSQALFYKEDRSSENNLKRTEANQTMVADIAEEMILTPLPKVRRHYDTFQWHRAEDDTVYNINYRVEGPVDGPPVLLTHGFGANVGHFRHQFPALTDAGHRVYAVDLLGFGASDKPDIEYSIELFAELLKDFVLEMDRKTPAKKLSRKKWVVAGNSIGGLCSLAVAEHLPDLVRGVVLFNCAGGMTAFRYEDLPTLLRPVLFFFKTILLGPRLGGYFFSNFKTRKNVESILRYQGVYRDHQNVDEELMETLLEPGNDEGAKAVFLKVFGGPPGPTPESILAKLDCPVLAIWGGADPWTPVDKGMHPATEFHRYIKEENLFELVVLDNVGHCPHDEAPDQVNGHMIPWIQNLPLEDDNR